MSAGRPPVSPVVLIKGAGEMASACAWRLHRANIRRICMTDLATPLCVRRRVAFCPALEEGSAAVEGVEALAAASASAVEAAWAQGRIAVVEAGVWDRMTDIEPDVVVDAILAKRNTGTTLGDAPTVIALGPGFEAGWDCHMVIETDRGHDLGRIITEGAAAPNTGIPGAIAGVSAGRVVRAPAAGTFRARRAIGDVVAAGDVLGDVDGAEVVAGVAGVVRGLIRDGTPVGGGLKLGDVDPRADPGHCTTISDKARAIAGSVLEAVMHSANAPR